VPSVEKREYFVVESILHSLQLLSTYVSVLMHRLCCDATVCKHVHTVHHLRKQESIDASPVKPSGIQVQNTEVTEDTELEDSTSTANNGSVRLESVRKQLQSKLQQFSVDVSVCNDTEAVV